MASNAEEENKQLQALIFQFREKLLKATITSNIAEFLLLEYDLHFNIEVLREGKI